MNSYLSTEPHFSYHELHDGYVILGSDGLFDNMRYEEIAVYLTDLFRHYVSMSMDTLYSIVDRLVDNAKNNRRKADDITGLLIAKETTLRRIYDEYIQHEAKRVKQSLYEEEMEEEEDAPSRPSTVPLTHERIVIREYGMDPQPADVEVIDGHLSSLAYVKPHQGEALEITLDTEWPLEAYNETLHDAGYYSVLSGKKIVQQNNRDEIIVTWWASGEPQFYHRHEATLYFIEKKIINIQVEASSVFTFHKPVKRITALPRVDLIEAIDPETIHQVNMDEKFLYHVYNPECTYSYLQFL